MPTAFAGRWVPVLLLLGLCLATGCRREEGPAQLEIDVFNPHTEQWLDAPVRLRLENYDLALEPYARVYRDHDGTLTEIPSQLDDMDLDGRPDELFFLVNLDANETARYVVRPDSIQTFYPPRAAAMLPPTGSEFPEPVLEPEGLLEPTGTVHPAGSADPVRGLDDERSVAPAARVEPGGTPDAAGRPEPGTIHPARLVELQGDRTANDARVQYSGLLWESDRVAYMVSFDERSLTDVLGKSRPGLIAAGNSLHGDSLLATAVDVLLEGTTLGLGTPAVAFGSDLAYLGSASHVAVDLLAGGPLRAVVRATYTDVAVGDTTFDVVSEREIHAGSLWTEQRIRVNDSFVGHQLVTGIPRSDAASRLQSGSLHGVFFLYTLGRQSAPGDSLGIVLLVPDRLRPRLQPASRLDHRVRFSTENEAASYRYMAAWEQESDRKLTEDSFIQTIRRGAERWMNPVQVSVQR